MSPLFNILIVSQDPTFGRMIGEILSSQGHGLDVVDCAEEAYAYLSESKTDLVLLGLKLPDSSGFDVLKWIRSNHRTKATPVLVFSALSESRYQEQAAKLGATGFIAKPCTSEDLLSAISAVLEPSLSQKRILVVDDEESVVDFCKAALQRLGVGIEVAYNGSQALAQMKSKRFDLVLTDNVPLTSGQGTVLGAVRKDWPQTKIVAMSASQDPAHEAAALRNGALATLRKPFEPGQLADTIRRCLL